MTGYKSIFKSKTVWGGVFALFAGFGELFGYALSPEDQKYLLDAVPGVISTIGGILAIFGRIQATKQIGK